MNSLLYIQASPRGERSKSTTVANAFLAAYRTSTRVSETLLNLFDADLPAFDAGAAAGKYAIMHGTEASAEVKAAFARVEAVIETFKAADIYLFAVPMWNFGIPYRLKHYLDLLVQPGYTFTVGENGYEGLLTGKTAITVYARGGDYSTMDTTAIDFQRRYLELILGFMGIDDVHAIIAQPTLAAGPDAARDAVERATEEARGLAARLTA